MNCSEKLKCNIKKVCNPSTPLNLNSVLTWFYKYINNKCTIKYLYVDSTKNIQYSESVNYIDISKELSEDCMIYFTIDKISASAIYIYLNLFNKIEKINNYTIGHHITICNFLTDDNKSHFGFHITVYNPFNIKQIQYKWYCVENKDLIYIDKSGIKNIDIKPEEFLINLWNHIKCGIESSEIKIVKTFASLLHKGGQIKIKKFSNKKTISNFIKNFDKKHNIINTKVFKINFNNIILIIYWN